MSRSLRIVCAMSPVRWDLRTSTIASVAKILMISLSINFQNVATCTSAQFASGFPENAIVGTTEILTATGKGIGNPISITLNNNQRFTLPNRSNLPRRPHKPVQSGGFAFYLFPNNFCAGLDKRFYASYLQKLLHVLS